MARGIPRFDLTPVLVAGAAGAAGTVLGILAEQRRARRRELRLGAGKELGFLSLLSHELKTPLNIALGYLDLMDMEGGGVGGTASSAYVASCRRSLRQLANVLEDLLTWSGLVSGTLRVGLEAVELRRLCWEVMDDARGTADAKGLHLMLRLPDEERWVYADPPNLRHILRNLVSNAVKFTDAGEVELTLEADPDAIVVRVSDTGIGLSPAQAARVFEPFWQADRTVTRRHGGAGLGLAVARRLSRLLGGDIRVSPRPAGGTAFELRVPAGAASARGGCR
ncbi:MAG TPA: HAMP domain-containing sensor histidine kinase [Longimicrobiales bacterium]|nr:HAMP domain-containing sensor histidine kinase [Longimicrobiales bacterium]